MVNTIKGCVHHCQHRRHSSRQMHMGDYPFVLFAVASKVEVLFTVDTEQHRVRIEVLCYLTGKIGVEMEVLTAASVAASTIYDMCTAVQKDMVIGPAVAG